MLLFFIPGPMLPETLLVQNIPKTRLRELTIDLSGEALKQRIKIFLHNMGWITVSNHKRSNKTPSPPFSFLLSFVSFPPLLTYLPHSLTHSRIYTLLTLIFIFPEIIPIPFHLLWMKDILPTEEPVSNVSLLDLVDLSFT